MSYTSVFGGTTIYPSDVSYLAITLDADKALEWPLESNDPSNPAARVIDVTTTGAHSIVLPDATQTGAGQTILFNNLSPSTNSFTLKDYSGATIATVGIGEQWQVYLAGTATAAGTWRVFQYGASTATVQASALAGYGLTVTSNLLSQSMEVTTFNSNRSALVTDRASALVWNGTGTGTLSLLSAVAAGNNFFIGARNSGGGDLTIVAAGSETIDGDPTLVLRPGESTSLITDGLEWYTLGLGQEAVFAFDYTSITVTGGTYTLAGSELNRIAYKFVGTLTADQYIVVPSTIQQYWVDNGTTGAYSFYLQTSGGTPLLVQQGSRGIFYCNGSQVVDADTATIALPVSPANGGTGITSYTVGDLLYASGSTTLSKLSDIVTGNALLSGGVGGAPSWGKIGLTTHVSGTLPASNGGTGLSTLTANGVLYGNGTSALGVTAAGTNGQVLVGNTGGAPSWATLSGIGVTSFSAGTTGLTPSVATTGAITLAGTLGVANGGTGTTTQFTAGSVVFAGASGVYSQDNANLFWDDSNNRLGIGTSSPADKLDVTTSARISGATALFSLWNAGSVDRYGYLYGTSSGLQLSCESGGGSNIQFLTAGAERMRVDSSGNVGIGTSSPSAKLNVVGGDIKVDSSVRWIGYWEADTIHDGYMVPYNASGQVELVSSYSAGGILFKTGNSKTERARIDSSGNVGIGTSSPGYRLTVAGTGGSATMSLLETGVRSWGIRAGGATTNTFDIADFTAGASRLLIDSSGNVGIGTSSPSSVGGGGKLVIAGNLTFDQNRTITFNGVGQSLITNPADAGVVTLNTGTTSGFVSAINIYGGASGAPNVINFATASVERMRIDASGNVGIGTSSPSSFSGYTSLTVSNPTNGGLLEATNGTRTIRMQSQASGSALIGTTTSHNLGVMTAGVERVTLDTSGNLGLGVTPSAWFANSRAIQMGSGACVGGRSNDATISEMGANQFINSVGTRTYISTAVASLYEQNAGQHRFYTAPSGTAGNAISFTQAMTLDASGNLLVGTTSNSFSAKLNVTGTGSSTSPTNLSDLSGALILLNSLKANTAFAALGYQDGGGGGAAVGFFRGLGYDTGVAFYTNSTTNPVSGGMAERMRIDSSGNLLVGTTSGTSTITATGVVESTTGGFKFPDATTQTTKGIAAALTQITSVTASGTAVTFSNIPQTYTEIYIEVTDVSHNGGTSQTLRVQVSTDGVTYTTALNMGPSIAAAASVAGVVSAIDYSRNYVEVSTGAISSANASPYAGFMDSPLLMKITGGIKYVSFIWGGGASFDAGTITLYGR